MADEQKPDPEGGNPVRPDWLPEKFKDEEAFVKSYGELESKLGELSERAKQADTLEENYNELAVRLEQVEQQRHDTQANQAAPLITAYEQAYAEGDAARMLYIQAEVAKLAVTDGLAQALPQLNQQVGTLAESQANEISAYAARTLEQQYGDQWGQATDSMRTILTANPHLIPEAAKTDPSVAIAALDNVYKIATYGATPVQRDDGAAEREKQLAQTASGFGNRVLTPDEAKQEWDSIKGAGPSSYHDALR